LYSAHHKLTVNKGDVMLTDNTLEREVVIACDPNAIPAESRQGWIDTGRRVYAAVQAIQEIPTGYRFRLPTDSAMLLQAAEYISIERLCCAFLRFTLEVEPQGGSVWLSLSGGEGVKEYIRSVFEANDLLKAEVLKAAGLYSPGGLARV
jgi:hypothetical protein